MFISEKEHGQLDNRWQVPIIARAMVKVWNADLAHACEVRVWYHMSKGSSKEFMWRKAHQAQLGKNKFSERGNVRCARISQPANISQPTIQLTKQLPSQRTTEPTNLGSSQWTRRFASSARAVLWICPRSRKSQHCMNWKQSSEASLGWWLSCTFVSRVGSHEICSWRCRICESVGMVRSWPLEISFHMCWVVPVHCPVGCSRDSFSSLKWSEVHTPFLCEEKAIVPPEMQQAAEPPERDYAQHPYLKRMQFRGGGYAILMALHLRSKQTGHRQFMYKSRDQLWTNLLLVRLGMFKSNPTRPCFLLLALKGEAVWIVRLYLRSIYSGKEGSVHSESLSRGQKFCMTRNPSVTGSWRVPGVQQTVGPLFARCSRIVWYWLVEVPLVERNIVWPRRVSALLKRCLSSGLREMQVWTMQLARTGWNMM